MTTYISNRNSDGKTDENGHFRLPLKMIEGEVLSGFEVSATSSMNVEISAGEAKIPYQDYAYAVWSDATETLTIPTASTSGNRIDKIVAYVDRNMTFTSTDINHPGALKLLVVQGTAGSSPVAPTDVQVQSAVGAGNPWINIATITVPINATQIVTSNIDNSVKTGMSLSSDVKMPEVTTTDGTNIKFAVINEGDALPSAIPGSTLIVLVTKN